jgi:GUN4-like/Caspase domain
MSEQQPTSRRAEPILSESELLYSEYRNCDRWAIIVGISRYQYQGWNLRYADRDAEELYKLLLTPSGGNFKEEFIAKLTNEEATTGNITRALRAFLKKPAREDLVIIYFACHGTPDFDRPGNVYLLTHDTEPSDIAGTALPMREIDLSLKENLLAEKVIILADTCHSAAIGGGIGRRSAVDDSALVNRYLQKVSQAKGGIALLTSAEANEVSREDAKWGGGHGVFTHYLLEGMRGAGDLDRNGIVTVGELFEYVRDNVKRETNHDQHPSIGTNAYDRNLPVAILNPSLPIEQPTSGNFPQSADRDEPAPDLTAEDDLSSELGADYTMLRNLLVARKWKEADEETESNLQLLLRWKGIDDLPCKDLWTIDELWSKYSDRHFGFRVQNQIWQSLGGETEQVPWNNFCQQVGWLLQSHQKEDESSQNRVITKLMTLSEIRLNLNNKTLNIIPDGYLPSCVYSTANNDLLKIKDFFYRLKECRI